jgi:hypothetical protein
MSSLSFGLADKAEATAEMFASSLCLMAALSKAK